MSARFIFSTADDDQPSVKVKVFRGEDRSASANASIGQFEVVGFTARTAGIPQIEITFHVDGYGELAITAMDLTEQRELSVYRIG